MCSFSRCISVCVCSNSQPVRRHQRAAWLLEGRHGGGGVTRLGSGGLGKLSGDTCVVTGQLHYGLSGDSLFWLGGLTGQGSVCKSMAHSHRGHAKDREGQKIPYLSHYSKIISDI